MKNVYVFWTGEPNDNVKKNISKLESQGLNVILGPSDNDDKYLSENFKYYADAKRHKLHAMRSDIWRLYMLSNNNGIYIDINEFVGDKFNEYFDELDQCNAAFIKTGTHTISASWMYCANEIGQKYFEEALNLYKGYTYDDISLFPIVPRVVQWVMRNHYSTTLREEVKDHIKFFEYPHMRNMDRYNKLGNGSWFTKENKVKFNPTKYADNMMRQYKGNIQSSRSRQLFYHYKKFQNVYVPTLRGRYDKSTSKEELIMLERVYKLVDEKRMSQLLIWSKLYRIFTLKRLSTKPNK